MQRLCRPLSPLPLQSHGERGVLAGQGLTHPPGAIFHGMTDEGEDVVRGLVIKALVLESLRGEGGRGGEGEGRVSALLGLGVTWQALQKHGGTRGRRLDCAW